MASATTNVSSRKGPDPVDLPTFHGKPNRQILTAPATINRFGSERGRWWYGPELLAEITEDFIQLKAGQERVRGGGHLLSSARDGLAVSHEWNHFGWFCTLTIPAGVTVECWKGPTAPQPEWRSKPDGRILHGGLTQFLIYDLHVFPDKMFRREPVMALWRRLSQRYVPAR